MEGPGQEQGHRRVGRLPGPLRRQGPGAAALPRRDVPADLGEEKGVEAQRQQQSLMLEKEKGKGKHQRKNKENKKKIQI